MQKTKRIILSTRPLSSGLIEWAAENNVVIEQVSFIETEIIEEEKINNIIDNYLQQKITAIFTSINAVDAVAKHITQPPEWKIYCIGNTTKKLVDNYFGKEAVKGTGINAEELAEVIIKDKIARAIFFCGDKRREELPEKLTDAGVMIEEVVVYKTNDTPALVDDKYDAILFFSPSAVNSFFSVNTAGKETQLFAIGSTTSKAIRQYNENNVMIPASPGKENMVRAVVEYYHELK